MIRWSLPIACLCLLTACGGIGSGPFARKAPPATVEDSTGLISRPVTDGSVLMPTLVSATVEPALRGTILRITGVAGTRGYYAPYLHRLRAANLENSPVLILEYRGFVPQTPVTGPDDANRPIYTAYFIPDADLDGIAEIRVRTAGGETRLAR